MNSLIDEIEEILDEIDRAREPLEVLGNKLAALNGYAPTSPQGQLLVTVATMGTSFDTVLKTIMKAKTRGFFDEPTTTGNRNANGV